MLACAYLAGDGKRQTEIAETLGLSQATVSRLLNESRNEYLREEVRFLKEKLDDETMERVLHRASRKRLGNELHKVAELYAGVRGPVLRVFPSGGHDEAVDNWEKRLQEFSREAAPFVKDALLRANLCGISWGLTLSGVVSALQKLSTPPPREHDPVQVVPLCGELLGELTTNSSSSNLAAALEKFLNGSNRQTLSLSMVPAFIPGGFTKTQLEGVWKLIGLVKAYSQIFGEPLPKNTSQAPLAERLDMVLTSVGRSENPLGFGKANLLQTGGLDIKEMARLVLGDIAGVCIPRPGLSKADQAKLAPVIERWTGIRRKHLEECARRSREGDAEKGSPGVTVVAFGRNKARCVFEAVKLGLVNTLVIDHSLEEELEQMGKEAVE